MVMRVFHVFKSNFWFPMLTKSRTRSVSWELGKEDNGFVLSYQWNRGKEANTIDVFL